MAKQYQYTITRTLTKQTGEIWEEIIQTNNAFKANKLAENFRCFENLIKVVKYNCQRNF